VVGEHAHGLKLVGLEEVGFVDDQDGGAAAFGVLGGQRAGGLGGERGGAVGGPAAEAGDDGVVDAADADGGVGQVDDGVPGGIQGGQRRPRGGGLAGADLAGDDAEGPISATDQVIRAVASPCAAWRCSMPGARSRPNGMRVNP
jgi:hypothetical protein